MDLKEKILAFMHEDAYKPLSAEDLAEQLELKAQELDDFWAVLAELESTAEIIKTRFDKYGVPSRMNLVVGRLEASSKGFGFVVSESLEQDLFIPPNAMLSAMNNDIVVARINRSLSGMGKRPEGEIIRIVSRANNMVVGLFESSRSYGFVLPDDKRIGKDIFIAREDFNGAKTGHKVVVEITKWPEGRKSAEGKIVEVLGFKGDKGIEILSIIKKHNLAIDFPDEVKRAAGRAPLSIHAEEYTNRRDLRDKTIVTIDGEDAKDLDDAVCVEKLPNGAYKLGVHIADVSYYVKENAALDLEARERGTSVYLVDRVLPMLPQRLSNGICSLNAGEDRLAMSIDMEINNQGQVVNYDIYQSVIRVDTRLSYNIVRSILADQDEGLRAEYSHLIEKLEDMERLCHILRSRRMRRGAIDFDFPELKVKLDEQGKPIAIIKRVRTIAESVIEEFMLVANETIAEHMQKKGYPFMFRVHEEPDPEKMAKLNLLLHNFDQSLPIAKDVQPMALQQVLSHIAGRPEERIISTVMLRSLKQARYESENLGHFGLAAEYYTHFTSPIRRYPDLIVHRLLRETIENGKLSANRKSKLAKMLPEIALNSSIRERAAADAERETVDLKKVEYMEDYIGEKFAGFISGVTAFGFFVELENGIEGLVHVSSMDDDYYQYVEEQYALIGERTRKVFQLGEKVEIYVNKVNIEEKTIDFILYTGQEFKPVETRPKMAVKRGSRATASAGDKKRGKSKGKPAPRTKDKTKSKTKVKATAKSKPKRQVKAKKKQTKSKA